MFKAVFLIPWTLSALAVHWSVLIATMVSDVFLCLAIGARHLSPPLRSSVSVSCLPTIIIPWRACAATDTVVIWSVLLLFVRLFVLLVYEGALSVFVALKLVRG